VSPPKKTASGTLLERAVSSLGAEVVAASLSLNVQALEGLLASEKPMNLEQQRTLALAIYAASENHPELRRRAMSLLAQVRAAADFEAGVTERHAIAPSHSHRWE